MPMPTVDVRLFAALRDIAGASSVRADGETVGDLLGELSTRYGGSFARIARAGTVVVDGERASPDRRLAADEQVAVLPPFSGGA